MSEPTPAPKPSPQPTPVATPKPAAAPAGKPGTAVPAARRPATPPGNRVFVQKTNPRDVIIAVSIALGILVLIAAGIFITSNERQKPSRNFLSGIIVEKHDIGEREQLVGVSRKGVNVKEGDTGYWFDVKVDPPGKIYEVPVTKEMFFSKKVGDRQDFIRPPSEQR